MTLGLRVAGGLLVAVVLIGIGLAAFGTPGLDPLISNAFAAGRAWPRFWIGVTNIGGGEIRAAAGLLAAALLWSRKRGRDALILLSVALIQTGTNSALKGVFGRVRPELHPHLDRVWDTSFPSGHSAQSAALYLLIALMIDRRLLWLAVPLVLLIGASRIVLGVHWPTDVLAGWMEGVAFALIGLRASRTLGANRKG